MIVESNETLNFNITSTLTQLYRQVKESWTQDYYNGKESSTKSISNSLGYKRRSPFIPFALKNETGSSIRYTTFISDTNDGSEMIQVDSKWPVVAPGEIVAFTFKTHGKLENNCSRKY